MGRIIASCLNAGDVVALTGELGAGKTCLTRGIARGLGVSQDYEIASPTFTLINEYHGRYMLYHFDLYRLKDNRDMEDMGFEEYFYGEGVSVIEWAEKLKDALPDETICITMTYIDENRRELLISAKSDKVARISDALKNGGF